MRHLLTSAALGAIASALAATTASAETVISTATTTPVTTSATGDLRIASTGSIKPTSGAAVTINTNADVKNEGAIAIAGASNATGILANANLSGDITNTGTITLEEDYTPTDNDKDGDLDGPFAQGTNRYGLHALGGGTHTGNVLNSGTIKVEGNQSAGIAIDSALDGSLTSTGTINVLGNDSVGVRTSSVSGDVRITSGSVNARGANSVGVLIGGNVGGAVVIQGTVASTGYRSTTTPVDQSKLDSDDLLQGGSAVVVAGNVGGGILLDARPADDSTTDTDEDDDGIPDSQETTATVRSFGQAPALLIGSSTQDISVGAVGSSGYGLVVKGSVSGEGVYDGVSATGIAIGGQGRTVSLSGGASISGTVTATARKADATAIHIGAGASVPAISITGNVKATGGGSETAAARAIVIEAGATVNAIQNSGTIEAALAGEGGSAAAIVDKSGTLTLVENSGSIGVTDAAELDSATAIDLSANTSGATVRQVAAPAGKPAPKIAGDIVFGTGNDVLSILAGTLSGDVDFGGGTDAFALGGIFRGQLHNSAGAAVTVGSGALLDVQNQGIVDLGSLTTNAGGALGVTIGEAGHTLYNVSGTATFGSDSKIVVTLDSVGTAAGTYKIVDAGTLVGGSNLTSSIVTLPFLFNSSLEASDATGEVVLEIELKGNGELGLNASEMAILDSALEAADSDRPMAAVFLTTANSDSLRNTLQQLLPEHAGGAFETATKGSRLMAGFLTDPVVEVADMGGWGLWHEQVAWGSSKSVESTSSYKLGGWGAALGAEVGVGRLGHVGLSVAYLSGRDSARENELLSSQYEGGIYWRGGTGGLRGFARAAASRINFDGTRRFNATVNGSAVVREARGEWDATLYSATGGAFYDARFGRFSVRPLLSVEHHSLREKGYSEAGGGDAFDLTVDRRTSKETAANALLSVGYELLGPDRAERWLRLELEGGHREILSGQLGATTARFNSGDSFALVAEERTSGWVAGLRAIGGGSAMAIAAELNAEEQQGNASIGGRLSIRLPM